MIRALEASNTPDIQPLLDALRGRRIVVLSGAGISTESGIPDYRGPEGTLKVRAPVQYNEFVRRPEMRRRYWARSSVGWPRISARRPNAGHGAIARLEAAGVVRGVITQNVDGLHQAAGSGRVVELHGTLDHVCCLDCGHRLARAAFQERLVAHNPDWSARLVGSSARSLTPASRSSNGVAAAEPGAAESRPDGDAELSDAVIAGFRVPGCPECDGMVKPDVVFFGENVPVERVDEAWRLFEEGDALLVVGSSLAVYSGRRFVYRARDEGVPICVVNLGPTRADDFAAVKVPSRLGEALPALADALAP